MRVMKPRYLEGLIKHLLIEHANGDQGEIPERGRITRVSTFAEAGYTDKPAGVVVGCADGSQIFVQFVGTAPDGGNYPEEPHYYLPPSKVGTERYGG